MRPCEDAKGDRRGGSQHLKGAREIFPQRKSCGNLDVPRCGPMSGSTTRGRWIECDWLVGLGCQRLRKRAGLLAQNGGGAHRHGWLGRPDSAVGKLASRLRAKEEAMLCPRRKGGEAGPHRPILCRCGEGSWAAGWGKNHAFRPKLRRRRFSSFSFFYLKTLFQTNLRIILNHF